MNRLTYTGLRSCPTSQSLELTGVGINAEDPDRFVISHLISGEIFEWAEFKLRDREIFDSPRPLSLRMTPFSMPKWIPECQKITNPCQSP